MKKVKIKMSHEMMVFLSAALEGLVNSMHSEFPSIIMRNAIWLEVCLQLKAKSMFRFEGDKKITLSIARASGLLLALNAITSSNDYYLVNILRISGEINKQLL